MWRQQHQRKIKLNLTFDLPCCESAVLWFQPQVGPSALRTPLSTPWLQMERKTTWEKTWNQGWGFWPETEVSLCHRNRFQGHFHYLYFWGIIFKPNEEVYCFTAFQTASSKIHDTYFISFHTFSNLRNKCCLLRWKMRVSVNYNRGPNIDAWGTPTLNSWCCSSLTFTNCGL